MPKAWLYYIALLLPLILRVLILNTTFVEWLWYERQEEAYYFLSALSVEPLFIELVGSWPFVAFTLTVLCHWLLHHDYEAIPDQFLLLPLLYLPFSVLGNAMIRGEIHMTDFITHPLAILPMGYAYVLVWVIFVRIMDKCRLVM